MGRRNTVIANVTFTTAAPLLTAPPELAVYAAEMDQLMKTYQVAIRDGEFKQSKLCLLQFMRACTHSYAACERLARDNNDDG